MGEQTILCGVLQTASILLFDKMVSLGIDKNYASKLLQNGWEVITESLKHGGITKMMDQLSDQSKVLACELSDNLKSIMKPLNKISVDPAMHVVNHIQYKIERINSSLILLCLFIWVPYHQVFTFESIYN